MVIVPQFGSIAFAVREKKVTQEADLRQHHFLWTRATKRECCTLHIKHVRKVLLVCAIHKMKWRIRVSFVLRSTQIQKIAKKAAFRGTVARLRFGTVLDPKVNTYGQGIMSKPFSKNGLYCSAQEERQEENANHQVSESPYRKDRNQKFCFVY